MENKEGKIAYILENFDFDKVHNTMTHLNWYWYSCEGTPSHYDLIKRAREMLEDVVDRDVYQVATGGFKATNTGNDLKLEFVVTNWDSIDMPE